MQGSVKIMEKISSLTFQRIAHSITAIDCQPMFDGGILINVLGQLKVCKLLFVRICGQDTWGGAIFEIKVTLYIIMFIKGIICHTSHYQTDEDPPHSFLQSFVLQNSNGCWFIAHDIFRLSLHDISS